MVTIENLLEKLALYGGKIVCTASLEPGEIISASLQDRMYVDDHGLGFVWKRPVENKRVVVLKTIWPTNTGIEAWDKNRILVNDIINLYNHWQKTGFDAEGANLILNKIKNLTVVLTAADDILCVHDLKDMVNVLNSVI